MLRLRLAPPVLAALLLVTVAACGASAPSSGTTTSPGVPAATATTPASPDITAGVPSVEPTPSDEPSASDEPIESGEPTGSLDPSPSGSPSAAPGAADACSGSAENRQFFESIARSVDWTVLCGVLPKGWFVSQGSYRLANGGKLLISYKGPGGASIALSEGAWCGAADGCVPAGSELGAAELGPLDGTLYQTSDGFAVLAAPGENPSWLMTTKGLDQPTAVSLAARLAKVGG